MSPFPSMRTTSVCSAPMLSVADRLHSCAADGLYTAHLLLLTWRLRCSMWSFSSCLTTSSAMLVSTQQSAAASWRGSTSRQHLCMTDTLEARPQELHRLDGLMQSLAQGHAAGANCRAGCAGPGQTAKGPWQPQWGGLEGRAMTVTLRYSFRRSQSE